MSIDTNEWLATMRSARRAGIDRDEREAHAASAARLARTVVPEEERSSRRVGELVALAACIVVCALGLMWLRHTFAAPAGFVHEIRAEQAPDPAPPAPADPEPVEDSPVASPPALGVIPELPVATPAKPKLAPDTLPPLPRPPPPPAKDEHELGKMERFELRMERHWRKHVAPPPPPAHGRGRVHDL